MKHVVRSGSAALLLSACATAIPVTAPVGGGGAHAGPVEVALSIRNDLLLVPARIPGIDRELTMLVDTGAPMVLDRAIAEQLGFHRRASNELGDSTGHRVAAAPIEIPELHVGDLVLQRLGGFAIDLDLDPCLRIDGVLGIGWPTHSGFFDRTAVEIDYAGSRLRMAPSGDQLRPGGAAVRVRRNDGVVETAQIVAEVGIEDQTVWALLDTGNAGPLYLAPRFFVELGHSFADADVIERKGKLSQGASGSIVVGTSYETRLRSLRLGDAEFRGVPIAVETSDEGTTTPAIEHPMLGNELMRNFTVVLDLPAGVARFIPAPGRDPSDARVGFGMALRAADGGARVVTLLEGGPASRAGIELGDEIVAVDGQPVHADDRDSVCAARSRLENPTGAALRIRARRDGVETELELVPAPSLAPFEPLAE